MVRTMRVWVGVVLTIGWTALVSCFAAAQAQAAPEQFAGTWFGSLGWTPCKLTLSVEGGEVGGSLFILGARPDEAVQVAIDSATIQGDKLLLKVSEALKGFGSFTMELRQPKNELVGQLFPAAPADIQRLPLVVSKDAPDLAARFAAAKVLSAEEMRKADGPGCQNNIKRLGLVCKMFENESKGQMWPGVELSAGHLTFRLKEIYPEYLVDPAVLVCPGDAAKAAEMAKHKEDPNWFFANSSYWYWGYALRDEKTALAFVDACRKAAGTGQALERDLEDKDGNMIYRLREGIERLFITDINNPAAAARVQADTPVVIELPGNHDDRMNVLFMDGHVESLKYPGKFPASEGFIRALKSLDSLKKP